jgi:hypothetical protein
MSDGIKHAAESKADGVTDIFSGNNPPQNLAWAKGAGPGKVALELSRIKECLRDLGTDNKIPREERELLRGFYVHRRNAFQLRLAVLSEAEKVKAGEIALERAGEAVASASSPTGGQFPDNPEGNGIRTAESEFSAVEASLVKARTAVQAASSELERLQRDGGTWEGQEAAARRWEMSREWAAITPDELKPAVEAVRYEFEHHACWRPEQSTMRLCYAALHPRVTTGAAQSGAENLSPYRKFLVALLGRDIERLLLGPDHPAPVIFKMYLDVLEAALKVIVREAFQEIFEVAEARRDLLHTHSVEWTKRQVEILISEVKPGIRFWIKGACDNPSTSLEELNNDSIFWGSWRAARLIHMQPAGNTGYEEATAWAREELVRSEEILEGRAERVTQFLRIELDEIVRSAHIGYVKRAPSTQVVPPQRERARTTSFTPTVPSAGRAQSPDIWRGLHERFRELSEKELTIAPRNVGDRWLHAYVDYKNGATACGHWHLSEGVNESSRERFEVEGTRAGIALASEMTGEPLTIWLHHVFSDLLVHKSALLFAGSEEGGIILRVSEASAIYCARLEKQALIDGRNASSALGADHDESAGSIQASELGESQSSALQQAFREAVIKKVKNPQEYTLLSTPEAAMYFQVQPRTIYRWTIEGNLRSGARRGSITIDSVIRLEKKRSRKRPNAQK